VAGLWKERILYGLAWKVKTPMGVKRPPLRDGKEVYCGPSWSWVSLVGEITHGNILTKWEGYTPCAVVESCVLQPSNKEFHQPVRIGTALCLRGRLQPLYYAAKPLDTAPVLNGTRPASSGFVCGTLKLDEGVHLDSTKVDDHQNDQLAVVPFICRNRSVFALILRKVNDGFERIGLLHSSGEPQTQQDTLDALLRSDVRESSFQIV
jgi:hypothetical protein